MLKVFIWLIIIAILAYGIYFTLHVIEIRLNYSDIKDKAETMLGPSSTVQFNKIPDELMEYAERRNVPLIRDSIKIEINRWEGYRYFSFRYRDSLLLFNRKSIYFNFFFSDTLPIE